MVISSFQKHLDVGNELIARHFFGFIPLTVEEKCLWLGVSSLDELKNKTLIPDFKKEEQFTLDSDVVWVEMLKFHEDVGVINLIIEKLEIHHEILNDDDLTHQCKVGNITLKDQNETMCKWRSIVLYYQLMNREKGENI